MLALALMASAATADPPKTPDPRDRINIWEGHWKIQSQRKETVYSHAASVSFDADCSWMPNRGYMVCDYLVGGVDLGDRRPVKQQTIFAYNDTHNSYNHAAITGHKTLKSNHHRRESGTTLTGFPAIKG